MSASAEDFFDNIRDEIARRMHRAKNLSKRFMTEEVQREIWTVDTNLVKVGGFLQLKSNDELNIVEKDLLQTLTILVRIGWRNWARFREIFLEHHTASGDRDRTDRAICEYTFEGLVSDSFLASEEKAQSFLDNRYAFQPLIIEEGSIIVKGDEGWRLPFQNDERKVIGKGSYGEVTMEVIAARQFRNSKNMDNKDPMEVACKAFLAKDEFKKEMENLKILRDALAEHKRIAKFLAITSIGKEFIILSPLASMDLRVFLYKDDDKFRSYFKVTIENMVEEAKNLVDALHYLHDEIKIPRIGHLSCCHMDLKPENILVYEDRPYTHDPHYPVGKWMISDFGISSMGGKVRKPAEPSTSTSRHLQVPMLAELVTKTTRITPERGTGTWQAPEVHWSAEKISGKCSDVWSYGCIFIQILERSLGGVEGLRELDERRRKPEPGARGADDTFYRGKKGDYRLNPEIERWIKTLTNRAEGSGVSPRYLEHCEKLIWLILKINPDDRLSATKIWDVLKGIDTDKISKLLNAKRSKPLLHQHPSQSLGLDIAGPSVEHGDEAVVEDDEALMLEQRRFGGVTQELPRPSVLGLSSFHSEPASDMSPAHGPPIPRILTPEFEGSHIDMTRVPDIRSLHSDPRDLIRESDSRRRRLTIPPPGISRTSSLGIADTSDIAAMNTLAPTPHHLSHRRSFTLDVGSPTSRLAAAPENTTLSPAGSSPSATPTPIIQATPSSVSATPPFPHRASDEGHETYSGRTSASTGGDSFHSRRTEPSSLSQVFSMTLSFDLPKEARHTIISTCCRKVAFVAHEWIIVYVMNDRHSRQEIPKETGIRWIRVSLSETFLLARGQTENDLRTVFYLYELKEDLQGLLTHKFVYKWLFEGKTPHLDGVVSRNNHVLFQDSTSVLLVKLTFRQGELPSPPKTLKVEGSTERCWFSSSGTWAFAYSKRGQDHHVNAWKVDDITNHHHYQCQVLHEQNFGNPIKDVCSFPDAPHCMVWKQNDHITIIGRNTKHLHEERSWDLKGLRALTVSADGEGFIYIQKRSSFLSKSWFEIFKSTVDFKSVDDQASIRAPGPGVKLKVGLEEGEDYQIAVDEFGGYQTRAFIGHRNGKVEEVTLL